MKKISFLLMLLASTAFGQGQTSAASPSLYSIYLSGPASSTVPVIGLKDGAPIIWSPSGTGSGASFKCNSSTSICTVSTSYLEVSGGATTIYYDGMICQSGSSHCLLRNTQAGVMMPLSTNTTTGQTGIPIGTSVADATAGVEAAVLAVFGTGVTTSGVESAKLNVTGAGPQLPQQIGTAGSGTGITVNRSAALQHYVHKLTVARTALTAAATTQDVILWTVPAKTRILRVVEDVTAAFDDAAGPISAVTTTCGTTAGGNQYLLSGSVFAVVTLGDVAAEIGAGLMSATVADIPSFTATTAIQCRWTSTGGNLSTLTTGSSTFYIEAVTYP